MALRLAIVFASVAMVAACSSSGPAPDVKKRSKEFFSEKHYGPASPRVVQVGQRAPKGGGRQMVGAPYRIAGKTYIPKDNPNYSATGLASWYGEAFHGRKTANGEVYDVVGLTAAHPTMPLPSYARVTNLRNGRSIIVRVNDRGPFAHDRVIDLSQRVAEILGYKQQGTTKVKVDYVGPARMDGMDDQMLLASYRDGRSPADATQSDTVMMAQTMPRLRPQETYAQPVFIPAPTYAPPQPANLPYDPYLGDDPLGPLIMRTGFANGYAAEAAPTPAQQAINQIAIRPDLQAALDRAVEKRAQELGLAPVASAAGTVVQLGSFGNADNAARAVRDFARFGSTAAHQSEVNGRSLTVVTVALGAAVTPEAVISAAADAGLRGAFIIGR